MLYTGCIMKPHIKKQYLQSVIGLIAYVLGCWIALHFYTKESPYRYWLILFPVIPIIYTATVIIGIVSKMDEMKRKIVTEAAAFAGLATAYTCFTYVFFRVMGAPAIPLDGAFYIMWIYYGIGLFFSWRRYK